MNQPLLKAHLKFLVVGWFSDPFCFLNLSSTFPWKGGCPSVDSPASGRNVGSAVTENLMKIEFSSHLPGYFRKKWYPQIIHFNRVFHYKPSILGYPYFWKHPPCSSHFSFHILSYFHRSRISMFVYFFWVFGKKQKPRIGHTISHTRDKCRKWDNTIYDVLGYLIMIDLHVWYVVLHFKHLQLFLLFLDDQLWSMTFKICRHLLWIFQDGPVFQIYSIGLVLRWRNMMELSHRIHSYGVFTYIFYGKCR